jgi:adenosine deaminase
VYSNLKTALSNYRLRVVETLGDHPVRRLSDAGVRVTVSTDDPLFVNSRLTTELALLQEVFDFTAEDILQLTKDAIEGAFLPLAEKQRILEAIDGYPMRSQVPIPCGAKGIARGDREMS